MDELQGAALVFGLFVLRCIVPLVVMMGLGYLLRRMDERWQAEAETERQPAPEPAPARVSSIPLQLPALAATPCWLLKDCEPAVRAECPANLQPELPCWLAHVRIGEMLPSSCPTCPLFTQEMAHD